MVQGGIAAAAVDAPAKVWRGRSPRTIGLLRGVATTARVPGGNRWHSRSLGESKSLSGPRSLHCNLNAAVCHSAQHVCMRCVRLPVSLWKAPVVRRWWWYDPAVTVSRALGTGSFQCSPPRVRYTMSGLCPPCSVAMRNVSLTCSVLIRIAGCSTGFDMGCRLFESLGRLHFLQTLEYDVSKTTRPLRVTYEEDVCCGLCTAALRATVSAEYLRPVFRMYSRPSACGHCGERRRAFCVREWCHVCISGVIAGCLEIVWAPVVSLMSAVTCKAVSRWRRCSECCTRLRRFYPSAFVVAAAVCR
jgi:hypothetical protein